jgi:hypothetical protein
MSWWWAPDLSGQHDAELSNDQHLVLQIKFFAQNLSHPQSLFQNTVKAHARHWPRIRAGEGRMISRYRSSYLFWKQHCKNVAFGKNALLGKAYRKKKAVES